MSVSSGGKKDCDPSLIIDLSLVQHLGIQITDLIFEELQAMWFGDSVCSVVARLNDVPFSDK